MTIKKVFRENWITRGPRREAAIPILVLVALLVLGTRFEYPASGELVYGERQAWRAWTTLFVHAGWSHLLANLVLFLPFGYALVGYFSPIFFPLVGFLVGGLVNLVVLSTLPANVPLVGVSGVVYWMGAAWVTLAFLVDRRERKAVRAVKSLGVSMLLFLPESYRPEVSYLTHGLGYAAGVVCAVLYYLARRSTFRAAERFDLRYDFDAHWDPSIGGYSEDLPETRAPDRA